MNVFEFAEKIHRLAAINEDEFVIRFSIDRRKKLWQVMVVESTDGHELIGAVGPTPEAACKAAFCCIRDALESWGYEMDEYS